MSRTRDPDPGGKKTLSGISASVRATVARRDGFRCIAPVIDPKAGPCRSAFGTVIMHWYSHDPGPIYLQMSHTKGRGELSMQKKAKSDPQHLVSLCPFHHTGTAAGSNWEAVHREDIRKYLEEKKK